MRSFLKITIFVLLFLLLCYVTIWAYSYQWLTRQIDIVYAQAPSNGYEFLGPKPVLTGFPFVPRIDYTAGFKTGNAILRFPEVHISGYPIPGLTFHLSAPKGMALDGIVNPSLWSVDTLNADIVIPRRIPNDYYHDSIAAWQKAGGVFELRHYSITKGTLKSSGNGLFSLDDDLQPLVTFTSTVEGQDEFIQSLVQADLIQPFAAAGITALFTGLSHQDEKTGEPVVTVTIGVRNRTLSVGPLQVARLPEIVWDTHTSPDPRQ